MKHVWGLLILAGVIGGGSVSQAENIDGYYRQDGTYVQPYQRTPADSNPYNNYGYPGNYNPNTGSVTGGNQGTYLDNYFGRSSQPSVTWTPYGME